MESSRQEPSSDRRRRASPEGVCSTPTRGEEHEPSDVSEQRLTSTVAKTGFE
jgi:hypothetical protein